MKDHRLAVGALSLLVLLLAGCGESPGGSPTGDGGVDSGPPVIMPGGSPALLAPRQSLIGQSGDGSAIDYYYDVLPGVTHAVLIENATHALDLDFYDDSSLLDHVAACSPSVGESSCSPLLASGRRFVAAASSVPGAPVTYTITQYPLVAQGTAAAPQALTDGYIATVSETETSYFEFEVPETGAYRLTFDDLYDPYGASNTSGTLSVEIRDPSDAVVDSLTFYSQHSFEMSGLLPGTYGVTVSAVEAMPALLRVSLEQGLGEGAPSEPVAIAVGTPTSFGVDAWSTSYFTFTTGEAGTYYMDFGPSFASPLPDLYELSTLTYAGYSSWPTENLEPDTTYYVELEGRDTRAFDLSITRGLASGTEANPVPMAFDVPFSGANDPLRSSYFSFVPTTTTSYRIYLTNTDVPAAMTWADLYGPNAWTPSIGYCWEDPTFCVTPPLTAGETYYIEVTGEDAVLNFDLSVSEYGIGEGTLADPVILNVNEPRASSLSTKGDSIYQFTTDADGGAYVLAHSVGSWVNVDMYDPNLFPSSQRNNLENQYYIWNSLAASTTHYVSFGYSSLLGEVSYQVAVLAHEATRPCGASAVFCADFEAGQSLVDFSQPPSSVSAFALSGSYAAVGSGSFKSGNSQTGEESCFRLAPAAASWLFTFAARGSGTATDLVRVYVDDVLVHSQSLGSTAWAPILLTTTYAPGHVYDVCYVDGSGGSGTDALWVDNLQIY